MMAQPLQVHTPRSVEQRHGGAAKWAPRVLMADRSRDVWQVRPLVCGHVRKLKMGWSSGKEAQDVETHAFLSCTSGPPWVRTECDWDPI